jgi:hypothetical protein
MSKEQSLKLESDLGLLFDIRNAKLAKEKKMNEEAALAQKDIKMLIMMFSDGIPSMTLSMGENENLQWDLQGKRLLYQLGDQVQYLDAAAKEILIRIRPYLRDLVKKAQDFYRD